MQNLELKQLLIIFSIGLINSTLILTFSKEQFKEALIATFRSLVQLMILGLILEKIFIMDNWLSKFLAVLFILMVGAKTLHKKVNSVFSSYFDLFFSLLISILLPLIISYMMLDLKFFSHPSFFIPFVGMLVGNSLTGLNLGLRNFYEDLIKNKDEIITFLSFGANPKEAVSDLVVRAMKNGLTPIINTMLVVGIVSIPGLMTGQMMAGANPFLSARYQFFLIIMIQSTVLLGLFAYFLFIFIKVRSDKKIILKYIGEENV